MIELLIIACLQGAPHQCREWSLGVSDAGLMACMLASQPQAAQWAQTHPRWAVRRTSCRPVTAGEDI